MATNWNDVNENKNKEGYTDYVPTAAERIIDKKRKMHMDMKDSFLTINELANENIENYIEYMAKKENEDMDISNSNEAVVEDTKKERKENDKFRRDPVKNRFFKLLGVLFKIADISGFRILNRLEIQDKKTGRIFK